ncbi:MAG: ribosomal protein S18-alanine N-acetyltransferase [Clostridia bacterium]|nr:ribosomal protein S18-alanine N-acetyltransferase [Clostridia bacterium]
MIITLNKQYIDDLVFIENSCFTHPMSKKNLLESISNEKYVFIGFIENEMLVGYGSIFIVSGEAYINNIAVLKDFRKKGIAKTIVNQLIDICKLKNCEFITLEVRESNFPAISLYEKQGFEKITIRKNYYSNPVENAIIMTKYFVEK